jgi:sulfate transport system ATP-binding protein
MRIEAQGISKRFGEFVALEDVTIDVPEGGLTALLGPSGSGKSTLLRIIAGLETPDEGVVRIAGSDVTDARPQERGIGFVFQHYAAFAHMTVFNNVAFGLKIRKRKPAEVRARVEELLALVGLTQWAEQRPHQLSGGQRQRMALARALAVEPQVLLLDEPFGALDANVRAELRRWLRRLHDEQGVTTVLVTHDQEEAMEVADTIAVMNHARIEQVGSPREVYDNPASPFVMGFLGPVSQIDGHLIRPHDVTITLVPTDGAVEAMVTRVVHLGFEVRIELELSTGEAARAQLTRAETDELELSRGDVVYVRPPGVGSVRMGPLGGRDDGPLGIHASPDGPAAPHPTDAGRSEAPPLTA